VRRIGGLLLSFLLTCASLDTVFAQPVSEDFPPGEDRIVGVDAGDRAPFTGQLFETDTALRWGFRLQRLRLQLRVDVQRERDLCTAHTQLLETKLQLAQERFDFDTSLLRSDREQLYQQTRDMAAQLASAGETPWYSTWSFGLAVGIVGTLALVVATGYLVSAI